jgi:hypothetical protein
MTLANRHRYIDKRESTGVAPGQCSALGLRGTADQPRQMSPSDNLVPFPGPDRGTTKHENLAVGRFKSSLPDYASG